MVWSLQQLAHRSVLFSASPYHSLSAKPINPTLIPLDDTRMCVFSQCPRGTSVPRAGSRTFASNQGKLHWPFKWVNCVIPKSRSWFYIWFSRCRRGNEVKGAIRTPTQAMSVPTAFRKGTICLPFVTELSKLGLNASPENNVRRDGWSA
jgi:hypothetical protein